MNTESIQAVKVEHGKLELPGHFCFAEDFSYIYMILPGATRPDAIRIHRGSDPGGARIWGWDGNEEFPTLTPSILSPNEWHGFLRAGKFESC